MRDLPFNPQSAIRNPQSNVSYSLFFTAKPALNPVQILLREFVDAQASGG
ncbi:MAG: hypothetical protein L0226_06020 [Acidobacteria bacterium]|nr:hypothetical protein [Acidobacteriota bacterium]